MNGGAVVCPISVHAISHSFPHVYFVFNLSTLFMALPCIWSIVSKFGLTL